jgi:hypothetical protein
VVGLPVSLVCQMLQENGWKQEQQEIELEKSPE